MYFDARSFAAIRARTGKSADEVRRLLKRCIPTLFAERLDVEGHMSQSVVAAVAARAICFGDAASDDYGGLTPRRLIRNWRTQVALEESESIDPL
jgi:hypothetical protein